MFIWFAKESKTGHNENSLIIKNVWKWIDVDPKAYFRLFVMFPVLKLIKTVVNTAF